MLERGLAVTAARRGPRGCTASESFQSDRACANRGSYGKLGMRESGVVTGKSLLLSDGHDIEDDCDAAEAEGVVPLDDGSIDPPLHPNCECALIYEVAEEEAAA